MLGLPFLGDLAKFDQIWKSLSPLKVIHIAPFKTTENVRM